jgi:hypothetical protein
MTPFDILRGKTAEKQESRGARGRGSGGEFTPAPMHPNQAEPTAREAEVAGGRAIVVKVHVGEIERTY